MTAPVGFLTMSREDPMHNLRTRRQYRLLKKIIALLAPVPRRMMNRAAVPLAAVWYHVDRHHRDIAADNLKMAYGGEIGEDGDVYRQVKANFTQLVTVALELPSLLRLSKANLDSYVRFSGTHHVESALGRGKGVLFLTAHLGNWELMALATSLRFNFRCHLLARPLDFAPLDQVLKEIRVSTGNTVVDKIRSARLVGKVLEQNGILAILLDQNASWYDGVYVPFFGRTACTNRGFALFALRYDPIVLPIFNVRQRDGRYHVLFDEPVNLIRSGDLNRDMVENTAQFNRIIEKHIRMAPDNWLWVHRRWRMKEIPERAKDKMAALTF